MQRRSLLAAVAAVGLTLGGLTACSNNPQGSGGGSQTLTFYSSSDYKAGYSKIISSFEKANPGVTVNASFVTGNSFESTENTQLAGGSAPDVLSVQPGVGGNVIGMGNLVKAGYLADLSDQSWAKSIPTNVKPLTDIDGKTYIYPGILQPLGAYYNGDALQKVGLTAPTTYSEVLSFCKAAASKGKVAYSLGLSDQWVTQLVPYAFVASLVYGPNPSWNDDLYAGKTTFPKSAWLAAEQKYLQMKDAGCFTKNANGVAFTNTLPPVAKGDALGVVQVGGIFGSLRDLDPKVTYQYQPLPATDNASQTYFSASPGIALGVNSKAKNKALAIKFVNFVAQATQINSFANSVGAAVPAIPNSSFKAPALLTTFQKFAADGKISAFPDTGWRSPEIQNSHLVGIQNMFLGKSTPQQVLQSMQQDVKQ